jgi:hypothetical protein
MYITKDQAKIEFEKHFGKINESLGYSLTALRVKTGVLVKKWYERNSWTDPKIERKVLFKEGRIFENNTQIGTYKQRYGIQKKEGK